MIIIVRIMMIIVNNIIMMIIMIHSLYNSLSGHILALLSRTVLTVGLWELFAVGPEALPVAHPPLIPHLSGHLI